MYYKIYNLDLFGKTPKQLNVGIYRFKTIRASRTVPALTSYGHRYFSKYHRQHKLTSKVTFSGRQKDSRLFEGGLFTLSRKRKRLDDLLAILSLLTGRNVAYYSRRHAPVFPLCPTNFLTKVSWTWQQVSKDSKSLSVIIDDKQWRRKYQNGFHLLMLLNHGNVNNAETRFLSMFVIWEWIYARFYGETRGLNKIFARVLKRYWRHKTNRAIFSSSKYNIFTVLRNQLAHSGKIPIDRPYSDPWMQSLGWDHLAKYVDFFTKLTQAIVMRTLNIKVEKRKSFVVSSFDKYLEEFLDTGKVLRFHR